ncbi:MAG: hypothetical protein GH143_04745 [Calditrichaeota bacterium]|nr:hypothetical protein [Calditrichota bacterium]
MIGVVLCGSLEELPGQGPRRFVVVPDGKKGCAADRTSRFQRDIIPPKAGRRLAVDVAYGYAEALQIVFRLGIWT